MNRQIGVTFTNHKSLEKQILQLRRLLEISRVLNSTLNLDALLHIIIEAATEITGTEAASILLLDEKTGELHFEAATGAKREEIKPVVVPLEGSIAGWIVSHNQSLVVNDVHQDPRHYAQADHATQFDTRSILGVPMRVKDKTIGVLEVLNKQDSSDFAEQDLETLETLAAQAAVAIVNARLFEQSDQLADIIHELRTPMTSIIGYSKILLGSEGLAALAQKNYLETISRQATRLGQMVNDFLDLAKLESGRTRLEQEPVNLEQVASEVVMLMLPQANGCDISLHLQSEPHLPLAVGDQERLKRVLVNLISNSIKYNREGGSVLVSLSSSSDRIYVSVMDTGYGISAEDLPRIFDKFYRVERDDSTVRGTGLGLSIVKQIVEVHGGSIWVESKLNEGSTFTFTLPLQGAAPVGGRR